VLNPPGDSMDAQGRFFSPWIERGSDGVPHSVPMPSMDAMRKMTAGQLNGLSERYGYVPTMENAIDVNKGYLSRFNINKGDPNWGREMDKLKENQQRAMLAHTRRLTQRHEGLTAIGGNLDQRITYICESSEPCDGCAPLCGIEGTYREFVENGTMPSDQCDGEGNCL